MISNYYNIKLKGADMLLSNKIMVLTCAREVMIMFPSENQG